MAAPRPCPTTFELAASLPPGAAAPPQSEKPLVDEDREAAPVPVSTWEWTGSDPPRLRRHRSSKEGTRMPRWILYDPPGSPPGRPSPPVRGFRPGGPPTGPVGPAPGPPPLPGGRPTLVVPPGPPPTSPPVGGFRPGPVGGGSGGFATAGLLSRLGVGALAFAGGFAIGTALDRRLGLSTGIANHLYRRDMEFRPIRAEFRAMRFAGRPTPSTTWVRGAFR